MKDLEKCQFCGKKLKPDMEAINYARTDGKTWDGHTYFPCECEKVKDKNLRISIG